MWFFGWYFELSCSSLSLILIMIMYYIFPASVAWNCMCAFLMYYILYRMEYFDDLASDQCADQPPVTGLPAIAVKNIHLTGVKAYCDEFPSSACRTTPFMFSGESVSQLQIIYSHYSLLEMFMACRYRQCFNKEWTEL